jgi:hypothetical protein
MGKSLDVHDEWNIAFAAQISNMEVDGYFVSQTGLQFEHKWRDFHFVPLRDVLQTSEYDVKADLLTGN